MAFVKLDTGILDSTLWIERDCREVFITALLMAQPRECKEPLPQLEIDTLELTGFSVPPGWYGFVAAAGIGIINRAMVEREAGLQALRKLGSPEFESRSQEFDGRRLIRVNGGYIVLNYMKYRDKDHTAATRQKNLRERRKNDQLRRDDTLPLRNITEAEADADADKNKEELLRGVVIHLPAIGGDLFPVIQLQIDHWRELFPAVDVLQSLRKMVSWLESNPKNKKTLSGMPRFISNWLSKDQDRAPRQVIAEQPKPKKQFVALTPTPDNWKLAQMPPAENDL